MTELVVTITPVVPAPRFSAAAGLELFVKRDDLSHDAYGGSKVRKLRGLLPAMIANGATDLITVGAAGSTHVLATTVHGRANGLAVHAVIVPQWDTAVAREVLAATLVAGATLVPVDSELAVVTRALWLYWKLRRAGRRPVLVAPGGTQRAGVAGCVTAGDELRAQLAAGDVPAPDAIVCALGSGGLSAGLAVAMARATPPCRVIAVQARHGWATRPATVRRWARRVAADRAEGKRAATLLEVVDGAGRGYGIPSLDAMHAAELLDADGIAADTTYVAKAAAWLLRHGRAHGVRRAILWGSFARPPEALRGGTIPHELATRLLRPCSQEIYEKR